MDLSVENLSEMVEARHLAASKEVRCAIPQERYAFVITSSYPSSEVMNRVNDVFILTLTPAEKDKLSAEIEEMFREDGDGNDCWLGLEVEMLGAELTADQLLMHCRHSLLNTDEDDA